MKKLEIVNTITRSVYKTGFKLKKHSPEILIVAGVVGVVASAVMACKASTKVNSVMEEAKEDIDCIHDKASNPDALVEYTAEEQKKELAVVYVKTGVKLARMYAPSIILGAASLTCILTSNDILRKRNAALAMAYAAIEKGFKDYRGRVIERFGKEVDRELKYNIRKEEIEETVIDEKGKEKKIKKTVSVIDPSDLDDFARIFDETNTNFDPMDRNYNFSFLKLQQQHANDLLTSRGWLFLNEVYEMLGFDQCPQGQIVGWLYDEKDKTLDNFVDFGFMNMKKERTRAFAVGYEPAVILDFNHQGYILDKVKF